MYFWLKKYFFRDKKVNIFVFFLWLAAAFAFSLSVYYKQMALYFALGFAMQLFVDAISVKIIIIF